MKKYLMTLACVVLVAAVSVAGTVAFLTDRESVANTFTVGNVDIKLDETKVNPDGTPVEGADRVTENSYHLIPGQTYTKDPTVTVLKGSEESYVRVLVSVNFSKELDAIFSPDGADLLNIFQGYDDTKWTLVGNTVTGNTRTYEFRYYETVNAKDADVALTPIFSGFKAPDSLTGDQLKTLVVLNDDGTIESQFTITVEGHAIQAATFADEDAAWAAFENQYTSANP